MSIALIDNADSFTGNIAQYLFEVTGVAPLILPNTTRYADLPWQQIDAFVLSPGPGTPSRAADFGVCAQIIAQAPRPILGVCLGHQGINEAFGGSTVHAPTPAHGLTETISHSGSGLFQDLPQDLPVVRYHSLISTDVPSVLEVTASTSDGLVMALAHRDLPIWGVQFHPESIASQGGHAILANFVRLAGVASAQRTPTRSAASALAKSGVVAAFGDVGGVLDLRLRATALAKSEQGAAALFRDRYAQADQAFWLRSVMGAAGPEAISLTYDLPTRTLRLAGPGGERIVYGDIFDLMDELTKAVSIETPGGWGDRFAGGFIGYFGYELKALTGGDAAHESPTPDASWLFAREFVAFDQGTGQAFDCHLVAPNDWPLEGHLNMGEGRGEPEVRTAYSPGVVRESALGLRDDRGTYLTKIEHAQRLITDGESYEICLTNLAQRPFAGQGLTAFELMRTASPMPYAAYLKVGKQEILSASPERFLHIDASGLITSCPIKGTRRRGATAQDDAQQRADLASSVKDRAENLMITDLVRHDLNAVCESGSVAVPRMFSIESYPSVHQMVSTVQGQLRSSPLQAVRSCFPPGSMTGAPKVRTMQIIDRLEEAPRGIYSGALGWLGCDGRLDLGVVIRTVVTADGQASWGIGGAITALSELDDEFEEILVKAGLADWALGQASPDQPRQP